LIYESVSTQLKRILNEVEKLERGRSREDEYEIDYRDMLVVKHAHTWKNILFPSIVKDVADSLNVKGETELANRLLHSYNSQMLLIRDLYLLQVEHLSTNDGFKKVFQRSICRDNEHGIGIYDMIEKAINLVMFRAVMGSNGTSSISEGLKKSYMESFIEKNNNSIIEWFGNFHPFSMNRNRYWDKVRVRSDEIASILLIELFVDAFSNVMKYIKCGGSVEVDLDRKGVYLTCIIRNSCDAGNFNEVDGHGLISIKNTVEKINRTSNDEIKDWTTYRIANGDFILEFKICENVLLYE
jgi:hypothetical protein